jgi:hypothetical protein
MLEPCRNYSADRRLVDIAATLSMLGTVRLREDDAERAPAGGSLAIFREIRDRIGEAMGLGHLAKSRCTYPTAQLPASISSSAWPLRETSTTADAVMRVASAEIALDPGDLPRHSDSRARSGESRRREQARRRNGPLVDRNADIEDGSRTNRRGSAECGAEEFRHLE